MHANATVYVSVRSYWVRVCPPDAFWLEAMVRIDFLSTLHPPTCLIGVIPSYLFFPSESQTLNTHPGPSEAHSLSPISISAY